MDAAIQKALALTKRSDTLIVVTADHSHAFTINGYPKRGNPIEGVGDVTPEGFAYETLSYINGPGYNYHRTEAATDAVNRTSSLNTWQNLNLTQNATERYFPHQAGYWMDSETHGGEDVPVYASGPMAHLLHGVHEQTHVPYTIAYSLCFGPYSGNCQEASRSSTKSSSTVINISLNLFFISAGLSLRLFLFPFH
jgi:alkaline phosphatase